MLGRCYACKIYGMCVDIIVRRSGSAMDLAAGISDEAGVMERSETWYLVGIDW